MRKFKYDRFINLLMMDPKKEDPESIKSKNLGAFTINLTFKATSADDYKLVHSWTLDGGSDIHVCNNSRRSQWIKTREATSDDKLFAGKSLYQIEAFGTMIV